ncbi:hypothetical protein SERLA73DRAFT_185118 [Serpula lacrymans var. lacrymans S7.3]|uniref:Glutamyl-tRNA(Gln) amidotransferase subunit A, mitochondrial n=2 Tax=Serpula lacrymans var. lacrymans TaxID=341189 RepID=F8Q430_SERL3|nr:glutamyl-tRNA amidotransferase subunit A [Serpula lacrymans var. lacrymans S7.9]EGN96886.1 hypothetical protein SERLA73DRAFT_185118 [Serpula lacrymans var. lacrymans S7.3]EGO22683.1 glutamyl-tRNA amidotransferase subunit A [Serpula lacrymans var. lacrymans S7.9]
MLLGRPYLLKTCLNLRGLSFHASAFGRTSNPSWRDTIQAKNDSVNALVHISQPEPQRDSGETSSLQGVAVAVKDNICTSSSPTTCSSEVLYEFTSPYDATVVEILRKAGADIVGKANCDEFGMGSLNIYSAHGPVVNPFQVPGAEECSWIDRERRSAGGSSGGSAAAVAAGMCYAALATDTGGSVRLPASYCGVVGLKPSYGLISRWGVVSFADSLDCVGVLAKSVDAVKNIFGTISSYDPKDPTSATPDSRQKSFELSEAYLPSLDTVNGKFSMSGLRIGIPQEYFPTELDPTILYPIRKIISSLRLLGASIVPVTLPSTPYALSAYYVIASAEASSNLARYDGVEYGKQGSLPPGTDRSKASSVYAHTRSAGFGGEVQKRILLGTYALTADAFDNYFLQAQRVRRLIQADFDRVFRMPSALSSVSRSNAEGVDVLLHPSAIRTAPLLPLSTGGHARDSAFGLDAYLQDILTVPASLAGLPALSVPAGSASDGWPIGASIVGQWGADDIVLRMGRAIEHIHAQV